MKRLALTLTLLALGTSAAAAQQVPGLDQFIGPSDAATTGRIIQLVLLITVLSVAPGLLVMVTCFTRLVVALSFVRTGIGLQSTPANLILVSLALFLTFFIMAPTFERAYGEGLKPLLENQISEEEAFAKIAAPFREFMLSQVRAKDLELFREMAAPGAAPPDGPEAVELRVLVPAFMVSELRRGFEIGFLIALPFLVIDLVVATLTMSMGMMMLPPTTISLPFKVLFFVLIDGWSLLVGSLMRSFT